MTILPEKLFAHDLDSALLRESFLVSAVVSIIVIRLFLKLTGYPSLGGDSLHIAHMLWGGMLMVVAFFMLLSYVSKKTTGIAAVIGGLGFGAFIDELGKFITRDNNYFFQPTIALIYIIFVLLFIISQALSRYNKISKEEYLINALEGVKEAVLNDMDVEEKKVALSYLKRSDQNNALTIALTNYLKNVESLPSPQQSIFTRIRHIILTYYRRTAQSAFLTKTVAFILLFQSLSTIIISLNLLLTRTHLPFDELGKLISSCASALIVLFGILLLRFSKRRAYRAFKISLFISIFFTQFFLLYTVEILSFLTLGVNILLLLVVDYVIADEEKKLDQLNAS